MIFEAAKLYVENGISVLPVTVHDKRPLRNEWGHWQKTLPTTEEINNIYPMLNGIHGIAVIGGTVSGNLEIIDFDNHMGNAKKAMTEWAKIPEVKEILDRYPFVLETTQSGGYHLIYRHNGDPEGSRKLAHEPKFDNPQSDQDWWTLIETRGEGGYCVVYPTAGYVLKKGKFDNIPTITFDEREILITNCHTFDQKPAKPEKKLQLKNRSVTQLLSDNQKPGSVFDQFNSDPSSVTAVITLMEQAGFKYSHTSRGNDYYIRPGKKTGVSVSFNGTVFFAFSSNAHPFPYLQGVNVFTAFALFAHNGDTKAALKEIVRSKGYKPSPATRYKPQQVNLQEKEGNTALELSQQAVTPEGEVVNDFFIEASYSDRGAVKYSIKYDRFIEFLESHGYRKFYEGYEVVFVRIERNLVERVEVEGIQSFVKEYVIKNIDDPEILSMIVGNDRLFTRQKLSYLEVLQNKFNRDDKNTIWFYFLNVAVKVTKDYLQTIEYEDLPAPIWSKHRYNWVWKDEYKKLNQDGEWFRFCQNVTGAVEKENKTFQRLKCMIGYLLNTHKQRSQALAMILIDAKIPTISYDANGGTGKSLIGSWIAKYRKTLTIDGRKLNPKNSSQFLFQGVEQDTQIIFIDDADIHFDFQMLFSAITSDMTIRKMYQGEYVVPFEESPKFLHTTNHSIRGTDDSSNRRKFEVGITDYYGREHTPIDDFGHELINDWDELEWAKSHLFAMECSQFFLEHGMIKDENNINQQLKKAISETSLDFVNFMLEQIYAEKIREGNEWDRKDMFQEFMRSFDDLPDYKTLQLRSFTNWIEKFARVFGLGHADRRSHSRNLSKIWGGLNEKITLEMIKSHLNLDDTAPGAVEGREEPPF